MLAGTRRTLGLGMLSLVLLLQPAAGQDVTTELPGEVRALLQKEMVQIQAAMKSIHGAIVRGQHEKVRKKGQAIHDSFILKQSMTPEMRRSLKAAAPKEFLKLDQEFHELAARLSESGKARDTGKQLEIFGQMTQACVSCHSRYVSDRFNGLKQQ